MHFQQYFRVPGENHRPDVSHWQTLSHNAVSSTFRLSGVCERATFVVIDTDSIGSYKSNYYTITTTTAPEFSIAKLFITNYLFKLFRLCTLRFIFILKLTLH